MIEPTNKIKNIMPIKPKGPNAAPITTIKSRIKKILRIHLAHVLGHRSESDSGLDNRTAMIEIMHMPGEITTIAVFSSAAPIKIIVPASLLFVVIYGGFMKDIAEPYEGYPLWAASMIWVILVVTLGLSFLLQQIKTRTPKGGE